ncbi:MAG: hypothetical protein Q7T12_00885 [Flavobacterium sp.]|nr:hypothetical protein [Flavobacterium sp.]
MQETAWAIQDLDNDIIISHDRGLYKFENGAALKIGTPNGFWKITKIKNKKGFYLGSTYNGLFLIEKKETNGLLKTPFGVLANLVETSLQTMTPTLIGFATDTKGFIKFTSIQIIQELTP